MKKPIVDEVTFGSNKDQLFDAGFTDAWNDAYGNILNVLTSMALLFTRSPETGPGLFPERLTAIRAAVISDSTIGHMELLVEQKSDSAKRHKYKNHALQSRSSPFH